ncbi:MAG: hypothetical protein IJS14_02870 [Lentisphaeria bacterium]|nr:hypothetical protein [Lentisphaeria bacterium]
MKSMLVKLFPALTQENIYVFLQGMFWALVLLAVLFVLTGLLLLMFRRSSSVSGITLETPRGSLFIAASAISDLIYSMDESFPDFEISRVKLIRDKTAFAIQVKVLYNSSGKSMLELTESFQVKALELLKSSFGIENVSRIDLIVPKSRI